MPAASSARSRRRPAGPTKGSPLRSSSSPGCSPTSMTLACSSPAPNTVCVAFAQSGQARQRFASSRSSFSDSGIEHLESVRCPRFKKGDDVKKLCLFVFALVAMPAWGQQDFSKVEIQAQPLGGTVYMLTGAGGNIGLSVGDEAVFMVDDQFAPLTPKIQE